MASKYTLRATTRDGCPAAAAYADGEYLASAGIVLAHAGVGEAWVDASPRVPVHARFFHQTIKTLLPTFAGALGVHRVQALVLASNHVGRNWMRHLGFHEEAVLHRYFGDAHAIVCVRFV